MEVLVIILAILIPVSVSAALFIQQLMVKSFLSHMSENATVGGQPRDIAIKNAVHRISEDQKTREERRVKRTVDAAKVMS